jgi:tricorn protease
MSPLRLFAMALFCLTVASSAMSQQETRLLRFPAIHGDQIVFSYAGDLYTVPGSGGVARRMTSDVGYEMFPRFSPDGKTIAFTAQYDGNTEVYVMPAEGGVPERLTYTATLGRDDVSDRMGPNNIVMTWRDNKTIVYRSRRNEYNDFLGKLCYTSTDGGSPQELPLPRGGFCSFSPDGKQLAYNRVFREFRTWKHYRGGQADEIWIYDFDSKKITNITNNPGQDIIPMWSGRKIYFLSDRDYRMNLFVYDLDSKETKKLTTFTDFDCKFPSLGDNAIVFENGGYIYKTDLATGETKKVPIRILEDFDGARSVWKDVSKEISNFEISPDGNRALFGAHGDVWTVPVKNGNVRNLTETPGIHERNSKWSPDGKWIAYISDASGEDEIYMRAQNGSGDPVRLTSNGDVYKYEIYWSPDSKKILWGDKKLRIQFVDVESKKITLVDQVTAWETHEYTWSPDSKWIAYARPEEKQMNTIYLYSLESGKFAPVTDAWFASGAPAFSSDGKYLFFVSSRTFNPIYGETEWNHIYLDMDDVYLLTLAKATKSPFEPKSDEVSIKAEAKGDKDESAKKDEKKDDSKAGKKPIVVDLDGIQQRITALPISAGNYHNMQSVDGKLYYIRNSTADRKAKLYFFDLEKQKENELGEVNGYEISADQKKMLVGAEGAFSVIDLPTSKIDMKERLNLSDMKMLVDRRAEWNEIFSETWRQMRDFMFAPNMHGVDWAKMKQNYGQLVPFVNHRFDLTYIIGEMIGELNIGHTYVGGGDAPRPSRVQLGLLGAKLERDPNSGAYRIAEILKGQNWDKSLRSPLTEIGVNVQAGEYIVAVDGKPTNAMKDIYASLVNKANKQVTLKVNGSPKLDGARDVVVVPITDERNLYYYNWVEKNIEHVNKATDGKVGYLHIPDMGSEGLNEFVKYYYPQFRKEALIVDVRGNGGGNVSSMIIERLRRELSMITIARNAAVALDPNGTIAGPKVMLINEFSASDGDIVGYRFRMAKLGPLVGKRTWGGVVGIRGSWPLLDGGFLNIPEFSRFDLEGKEWAIEGKGVEPDIYVDNDPAKEYAGIDEQLDKAIEVIKDQMQKHPFKVPTPPPYPDKSK